MKAFADSEKYSFPKPIGERPVFNIYGDEVSTIPLYIKTRNVSFKAGGSEVEFEKMLDSLKRLDKEWLSNVLDVKKMFRTVQKNVLIVDGKTEQKIIQIKKKNYRQ